MSGRDTQDHKPLGQDRLFGVAVEIPVGTPTVHITVPGVSFDSPLDSSSLLMYTLGGSR